MHSTGLPDGAYFSVIGNVRLEAGGQTRLALLRHRLFTLHAGASLPILTYNPLPSYDPVRAGLLEQGQLLPSSELRNLHEELRTWPADMLGPPLGELSDDGPVEHDVWKGYHWRTRRAVDTDVEAWDFLRPDGSRYLRTTTTDVVGEAHLCDSMGRPVLTWPSRGGLWRWWTEQIAPSTGRVFLISDSRFIAEELGRIDDPRFHLVHQMHNPHLTGDRRWDSAVSATYRSAMEHLADLDGLSSLTDRQRDDIAKRYGATNNLFVVPNPVEPPAEPDPLPARREHAVAMIARLDGQKRLDRAVEAFGRLRQEVPTATLDVYGDGPLREQLQKQIDAAGLTDAVTLHGHQPHAREALWAASVFWLTSAFEGYPLSTLEAMSHGCPVISMDMPYGPREQITDAVDGLLIGLGDVSAMAVRTAEVLRDPTRLAAMGVAARRTAAAHGHDRFLADWRSVIEAVVDRKPARRVLDAATWDLDTSQVRPRRVRWSGTLTVQTPTPDLLGEAHITAQAWSPDQADLVEVPMTVARDGNVFTVSGDLDSAAIADLVPGATHLMLRVGFVWAQHATFAPLTTEPLGLRRRWFG